MERSGTPALPIGGKGRALYTALHLAALTGLRRAKVLGLQWGDLNLSGRALVVLHTLVSIADEVVASTPKTYRPRRVELDAATALVLERHRAASGPRSTEPDRSALVFIDEQGGRLHPDLFTQRFDQPLPANALNTLCDARLGTHAGLVSPTGPVSGR